MRREWQMSKKSKNRYISHNDLGRTDEPTLEDAATASQAGAGSEGAEPSAVAGATQSRSAASGAAAGLTGAAATGAGVAGTVSSAHEALEASKAFVETAEVLNKGEGATLEDALAQNQAAAEAAAAEASVVAASAAAAAVGEGAEGEPAILHSSRALEDDPAVKAAQVLARDNAEELALREAEALADAEQVRLTAKENVAIPPLKPVDNIENLKTAGQVLRYHRQRSGLSIKEVADNLKARPTTIANIEADLLNTPNVQNMVGKQVILYANLLGLNPKEVHDLYLQGIKENVVIEHVPVPQKRTDRRMNRIWLIVVLMILVATGGYFVFGGKEETSAQGSLNEVALDTSHDTSAALVTSDSKLTVGNNAPVVIEEESAADAPQVMVVDENTAKATEQQYNLQQMQQAQAQAAHEQGPQPEALLLPEGVAHEDQVALAPAPSPAPAAQAAAPSAEPSPAPAAGAAPAQSVTEAAQTAAAPAVESAAADTVDEPAAETSAEAGKPQLAGTLKNISSSVKVVGRDGLASLNRAEVAISAPVALEVTDGSGKVVRSGVYNAGEVVKITAIPPIVVKLSDTSAVKISYMGGTIELPAGQQVRFELPQR